MPSLSPVLFLRRAKRRDDVLAAVWLEAGSLWICEFVKNRKYNKSLKMIVRLHVKINKWHSNLQIVRVAVELYRFLMTGMS